MPASIVCAKGTTLDFCTSVEFSPFLRSYTLRLYLNDKGDAVDASAWALNSEDAFYAIYESEIFTHHFRMEDPLDWQALSSRPIPTFAKGTYLLQPSKEDDNYLVITNRETLVTAIFAKGRYLETAKIFYLGEGQPSHNMETWKAIILTHLVNNGSYNLI